MHKKKLKHTVPAPSHTPLSPPHCLPLEAITPPNQPFLYKAARGVYSTCRSSETSPATMRVSPWVPLLPPQCLHPLHVLWVVRVQVRDQVHPVASLAGGPTSAADLRAVGGVNSALWDWLGANAALSDGRDLVHSCLCVEGCA